VLKEMAFGKKQRKYVMNEIQALEELRSKYVVWLISAHHVGEKVYAVMEYANAGALVELAKYQVCDERAIAFFALKILRCVEFLHRNGWVHRDLKADNIFLGDDGKVKLGDLGLAARFGPTTVFNDVVGTPHWIAPEVIDTAEYSPASDVWGIGVICRELLEGKVPNAEIPPLTVLEMIQAHGLPPIENPDRCSTDLLDFLAKSTNIDPKRRPTVRELMDHPFISKACKKSEIVTYIDRARTARENDIFAIA
jgi:serine/threonine protein kinase